MSANMEKDELIGGKYAGIQPAWHHLGHVQPEGFASCEEAAQKAHIDNNIHRLPLAGKLETPMGTVLLDNYHFGIYKEPKYPGEEWTELGSVGGDFIPLQNLEIAQMLDATMPKGWFVETVGALGRGEVSFFCLNAGKFEVAGELITKYFGVIDGKCGNSALKAMFTPTRFQCQNTLVIGEKAATSLSWFKHGQNLADTFKQRMKLIGKLSEIVDNTQAEFETLAAAILDVADVEHILHTVYPEPSKPRKANLLEQQFTLDETLELAAMLTEADSAVAQWEKMCQVALSNQEIARTLFERFNDEQPSVANTPWALYNAIVEQEDYRKGRDGSQYADAIFGQRAKVKKLAYAEALKAALK